jgi:cytochrome P450
MMNLLTDEMRRDPYPLYATLRSNSGPVFALPAPPMWLLLDYETVRRAVTDHETFSSAAAPPGGKPLDWLIFSDPPRHTHLRAIILRAFTPRSIAGLEPRVRELSRELLDPVLARGAQGEMDLVRDYSGPLPALVIAEMLGIPSADRQTFLRWGATILQLSYTLAGVDAAEAAQAIAANHTANEEMRAYLADTLGARRREPRDDLLSRLVAAEVDGQHLTEDEILGFFRLLLLAGTEATTNTISNMVLSLDENPEQRRLLAARPELLPSAIEEVLRYRSPTQFVFRAARREIELHGQRVPEGALVLAVIGAANRDPAQFAEPDRFDITRDPNPHIAFGHGIHFCIGAALARMEARVALSDLFTRLGRIERASTEPWTPRKGLIVLGPERLPIRFDARAPVR